jgi:hypothetical protein
MKPDDGHFAIDQAKAEEDAKFDGVFVLRTNARLSPLEAMLAYELRIPTKPATNSNRKPATDSDLKPAGIPI